MLAAKPFPREWTEDQIVARVRDAEKVAERGIALAGVNLWQAEGRTDAANGRRLARRFGNVIRYIPLWGKWIVWTGQHWRIDDACRIESLAQQIAAGLWAEIAQIQPDAETAKKMVAFAAKSSNIKGLEAMGKCARSEPDIAIAPESLDADAFKLNVRNGTVNLRTGELGPHDPKSFCMKLCPVEFAPTALCPVFDSFLDKIFGNDAELISFVQRLCGYALTGDVSEQIMAIFHGGGDNGKTTLTNVWLEILGDYAAKVTNDVLLERARDSHPTSMTDLAGKRLAVASETERGALLAESKVKELTGGEKITARRMREDNWTFSPTHKIILATNHRPVIRGTDWAIWRRIRLIPFSVTITATEKDKQLPEKLRQEYPGILAWMVRGCLAWQKHGLGVPKQVVSATETYRGDQDVLTGWLTTCCERDQAFSASASVLLGSYKDYSADRAISARAFAQLLHAQGFTSRRLTSGPLKGHMAWEGLRLADAGEG